MSIPSNNLTSERGACNNQCGEVSPQTRLETLLIRFAGRLAQSKDPEARSAAKQLKLALQGDRVEI